VYLFELGFRHVRVGVELLVVRRLARLEELVLLVDLRSQGQVFKFTPRGEDIPQG
jgi:hypothetical protein